MGWMSCVKNLKLHLQRDLDAWRATVRCESYWNKVDILEQARHQGVIVWNKETLDVKGFSQVKGLGFGETFTLVAVLEAIWILQAYASNHNIKPFQIDVKSAFLNVFIN